MAGFPPVDITVYPYECDAYGHLNEAAYLQLFERSRWEMLARGPGLDLFKRNDVWPAVRRATVDYHLPAFPGDVLHVDLAVERIGRTSLELKQRAVRASDGAVVAEAQLLFVMIDDQGRPTPLPAEVAAAFGDRATLRFSSAGKYDVGGVSLAVDVRGDGPALLLIHGFPLDRSLWSHQVATLARWKRIAPDLRGAGGSDAPDGGYSMAAYADDLMRLLDRMQIGRAVVAGLSMGGYVVFELLRRYRERLMAVVLANTRADADSAEAKHGRDTLAELARSRGAAAVAERMLPKLLGKSTQNTQPQLVEQVRAMVARTPVVGIVGALGAMRERPDSTPLLASIDVPTLVVAGQEDEIAPPSVARAMTAAIPSAAMTIIPGAGHLAPLEAPSATSRVIAEFLDSVAQ